MKIITREVRWQAVGEESKTHRGLSLQGTKWRCAEMRVEGKDPPENCGDKSEKLESIEGAQEFRL